MPQRLTNAYPTKIFFNFLIPDNSCTTRKQNFTGYRFDMSTGVI